MLNKKSRIDLHLHSCVSDGVRTPQEIVNVALANKIDFMALTDHDTIRNTIAFSEAAHEAGIAVLHGIEVSALFHSQVIHILGYGINPDLPVLRNYQNHYQESENQQALRTIANYRKKGAHVCEAEYERYTYNYRRGSWKLFAYLQDQKIISTMQDYQSELAKGHILRSDILSAEAVIEMIHQAQGAAVIAHIFDYSNLNPELMLKTLTSQGLDGIECYHAHHRPEQSQWLANYANLHHLLITGGSDDHGHLSDRTMGTPRITLDQLNLGSLMNKIQY